MAALVENMFYYYDNTERTVPWHGLGRSVTEAPTSADAIRYAGLDWKVESKPVFDENRNQIPGFIANTRNSDNSVLGIVSDRYQIIQNEDAFAFTDSLLGEGVTYETAGSLKNGKTVWLLARMPETKILNDKFDPYLVFCNTHDGTGAVRVCMSPVRVVCSNTLNFALSRASRSWSTRHMGDIQSKLQEAKHTLGLATNYMKELDIEADRLANIKVSDTELEEIFDAMFPIDYNKDSQRKINNIMELKHNLFKCYDAPDIKQFKGTAYGIMNAATDMVAHTPPARLTSNYQENNFGKIINGHPFVDKLYSVLKQAA